MKSLVYDTVLKMYVHSVNDEHMIVTMTKKKDEAKQFPNDLVANAFILEFADCGMGLNSSSVTVVR